MSSRVFEGHQSDNSAALQASLLWAPDSSAVGLVMAGRVSYVVSPCGQASSYTLTAQVSNAVWAPHLEGCGHLLLFSHQQSMHCAPIFWLSQPGAVIRLRRRPSEPFYLVCGVRHVALALSPCRVQLFTMQPGPVLQLECELEFAGSPASRVKDMSICFSPAGRYLVLITAERLHVVSTCSGKTLAVRALDPKSRWFKASDFEPIGPHSTAWHSSAHRVSAFGTSEFTGTVQIDVCFPGQRI